jgi:enoyl-CoA hydratase/carnithine racemase
VPDPRAASDEAPVLFDAADGVAHIVLNRPDKRNAITPEMASLIEAALDRIEADDDILVGVLSSRGTRAFSAGADLGYIAEGTASGFSTDRGGFGGIARYPRTKPLICAVQGFAIAGGFEIAMACDIVIAERDSEFALPEVTRGLIANGGGLIRLPRLAPRPVAMDMILTGARISAEQAERYGIVSRVVETGEAHQAAAELAAAIASMSPAAVQASLTVIDAAANGVTDEVWQLCARLADTIRRSDTAVSSARQFLRRP